MIYKLPENVIAFIDRYFHLKINNTEVLSPYFINIGGFFKSPVYAGKGLPEEIELEVHKFVEGKEFNAEEILELMHNKGLGIDCSGLIYHILDYWLVNNGKNSLREFLPTVSVLNLRKFISRKIKPQNSISADEFTSSPFSRKIELREALPGDLIRTRGGKHILFITEVEKDKEIVKKITFVNSARQYRRDGVRFGEIYFDQGQNLSTAKWEDNDPNEPENFTYKGYRESINNNGIFRPNIPLFKD